MNSKFQFQMAEAVKPTRKYVKSGLFSKAAKAGGAPAKAPKPDAPPPRDDKPPNIEKPPKRDGESSN